MNYQKKNLLHKSINVISQNIISRVKTSNSIKAIRGGGGQTKIGCLRIGWRGFLIFEIFRSRHKWNTPWRHISLYICPRQTLQKTIKTLVFMKLLNDSCTKLLPKNLQRSVIYFWIVYFLRNILLYKEYSNRNMFHTWNTCCY